MTDILIRGLSPDTVERLDREAQLLGLSRNEYLRRTLEHEVPPRQPTRITDADWDRVHEAFRDLEDPDVMDRAWQ